MTLITLITLVMRCLPEDGLQMRALVCLYFDSYLLWFRPVLVLTEAFEIVVYAENCGQAVFPRPLRIKKAATRVAALPEEIGLRIIDY